MQDRIATAVPVGPFWVALNTILLLDGKDNPPDVYYGEMLAVLYNLATVQELSPVARDREKRLRRERLDLFRQTGCYPYAAPLS